MNDDETAAPIQPKRSNSGEGNEILVTSFKFLNDLDETVVVKWHPGEGGGPPKEADRSPVGPGSVWSTEGYKTWNGSWYGIYRTDGTLICNFSARDEAVVLLAGMPRDYCFRDPD